MTQCFYCYQTELLQLQYSCYFNPLTVYLLNK